ncbi:MAG TPA: hypothetical protein VK733_10485 [Gemmatimonadaceae bacterium]|nr:hypothetical protein [Gemmatimonadaceae bacterium]
MDISARRNDSGLRLIMIVYGVASLLHFAHNAVYLREYPNMPPWLKPVGVWAAFLAMTAIGVLGYCVYRFRSRAVGVLMIAVYGAMGFGGLDHYVVAPVAAHSIVMNMTIATEAAAAATLLVYLARCRTSYRNSTMPLL